LSGSRLHEWGGRSAAELARSWGAAGVHLFARVGSTNDVARGLAVGGAPAGTLALAEEQVAGRGRVGRGWSSPPGLGLWFSAVARPSSDPGPLPLRVGLAVAEALDAFSGGAVIQLKWPNDLLIGGRKLGGILCEGCWEAGGAGFVVVGVGLNLLHMEVDFPVELREGATSLAIVSGTTPRRPAVADAVIPAVLAALAAAGPLTPALLDRLAARDALRGHEVVVTDPTTGTHLAHGTALGIARDGAILVGGAVGTPKSIRSGTVRLASDHSNG
jgi:BirA family biotin operon repressor/biotin-[acetyl-CoA-carboxylase] ligase